jgi:hypothetical protein
MLRQEAVADPKQHVIISLTGGFVHILIKNKPFTQDEVNTILSHFELPMYGLYFPLYDRLFNENLQGFYSIHRVEYAPNLNNPGIYTDYWAAFQQGTDHTFLNNQPQNVFPYR